MTDAPIFQVAEMLSAISVDQLREYCEQNPPSTDVCVTCSNDIVSTPCMINGSFLMVSGGWTHASGESSCGASFPFMFAAPEAVL